MRERKDKLKKMFWTIIGSFFGIGAISFLAFIYKIPLLLPSLGATAVILFSAYESPFARPKSVLGGHIISATVGVFIAHLAGSNWWSIALGVTLAIGAINYGFFKKVFGRERNL
ncbi:HPP family protein [Carboxydothermus hydrogenoformans]|uniref:Putative membrane protein n=1 Tax=Carboxydothermus hydrogenoformans (strain ATCC BAA-161 / DSM 6008 / Z-2901) TaxID=246194 RepID=Q3AAD2_CARHZ|nr:HPP family protein [Carboxydothermus hydrogenoformans]ABB14685.1 putative membrane protein [Carboxydothermus hydrogenoformans Z-2901]